MSRSLTGFGREEETLSVSAVTEIWPLMPICFCPRVTGVGIPESIYRRRRGSGRLAPTSLWTDLRPQVGVRAKIGGRPPTC